MPACVGIRSAFRFFLRPQKLKKVIIVVVRLPFLGIFALNIRAEKNIISIYNKRKHNLRITNLIILQITIFIQLLDIRQLGINAMKLTLCVSAHHSHSREISKLASCREIIGSIFVVWFWEGETTLTCECELEFGKEERDRQHIYELRVAHKWMIFAMIGCCCHCCLSRATTNTTMIIVVHLSPV